MDDDPVIVVGGGIAGLICASTLASAGRAVHVLDAGGQLGGRASTSQHDGYLLNEGAHALYPSSERLLSAAGVRVTGRHPRPDRGRVLHGGDLLPSPLGPHKLLAPGPLGARERVQLITALHSTWSMLTPSRGAIVQLLRYDDGSEPTADAALAQLEGLLDQAQPGWREHVVHRRFAPRLIASNHLPSPAGGLATRPAVDDTGLAGTFIAGDWVGSQGWLVGASLHSGVAAAQAVIHMSHAPREAVPAARAAGASGGEQSVATR